MQCITNMDVDIDIYTKPRYIKTGNGYMKITTFPPDRMTPFLYEYINYFRFPENMYGREKEIAIDKIYNDQSENIVVYKMGQIVLTLKIISKHNEKERLPIEFSNEITGLKFIINKEKLPVCEIGGLRIDKSLSIVEKYNVLTEAFKLTKEIIFERYNLAYITCESTLERMYSKHYGFKTMGYVKYDDKYYIAMYLGNEKVIAG